MALIKKIRERTGLAVGLVALGLIFFIVGGDILGPNSTILGENNRDVGEIAGESIPLDQYQQQIEEMKYNFTLNYGRNPTETELYSIRNQAWEFLIVKVAFQQQFDELGIEVTDDELVDMVQGRNIHPELVNAFTNPETGEVDRDQIVQFLQRMDQLPQQQQAGWYLFEKNLKPSRLRIKYDNLMIKSDYVPETEAEQEYIKENTIAEIQFLYVPYYSINDSLIEVNESELKEYIRNHEDRYQVEESRSLRYVRFPIVPSVPDTAFFREELAELQEEFRTVEDDSLFARRYSDADDYFQTYSVADLPQQLRANIGNLSVGDVRGPYMEGGSLKLFKIVDIVDDSIRAAKASHILIKPESDSQADETAARQEAQRILNEILQGADFAEMARQYSDDPSSSRGGDLGWFEEGRMVEPFENAVFNARSAGLINRVIETEYGYHLINVTEPASDRSFVVASIEREITPSDETRNEAYRKAALFASNSDNLEEFLNNAEEDSLTVLTADKVFKNDRRINNLANARPIVRWAFTEASVNDVSDVFETENEYVVVVLTDKTDEGLAGLEEVEMEVTQEVKNNKKAEIIIDSLNRLEGDLDQIAEAYGDQANVYSASDLKMSDNTLSSLPTAGPVPEAIGVAFGLNEGEISRAVKTESGIFIIQLEALTEAPEIADYSNYKEQIIQERTGSVSFYISQLVKDFAEIEDKRYRFY